MAENITMPQLGESIAEGTIVKWLKEIGDKVQKDENILLISTDKVEAEIPSPKTGVLLSIDVGPGETVDVGTVLGQVGEESELKEQKPPKEEPIKQESPEEIKAETKEEKTEKPTKEIERVKESDASGFLSPLVRKIAQENNLSETNLKEIEGTGRGGRISKNDILAYLENRPQKTSSMPVQEEEFFSGERETRKPISTMRKIIMENMVASKSTSAHVTTFFEIDYTAIDKVRAAHKEDFKKQEQVSLTYTTFVAAALCQVLNRHPYLNAVIEKDNIVFKKDIHLGIAVAIDNPEPGLMVPVIKNANKINLRGLAHSIADLSSRVRSRKIKPDEISGGTFTITNPGNYGAIIGTPIINQPQVAILGMGNIKKQVTVINVDGSDMIAIRPMGWLSLSFDHRLIDGATADIFMADLKKTLETWVTAP